MYAIIATEKSINQIRHAIPNEEIIFEKVGQFDEAQISSAILEASRVVSTTFILDIDSGPGNSIVKSIKMFRVSRPNVRIIILAPGKKPGDETISRLVSIGVYDIIANDVPEDNPDEEVLILPYLADMLEKPASTYADAARWDISLPPLEDSEKQEKERVKVKEKVVEIEKTVIKTIIQDRIIGTALIVVAGANRGVGCTHTAISIAHFFARHKNKFKVAYIELNRNNHIRHLNYRKAPTKIEAENAFRYKNIDFYRNTTTLLELMRNPEYNYIVADIGCIYGENGCYNEHYEEMIRANLPILVSNSKPWQLNDLMESLKGAKGDLSDSRNWRVFLTFTDEKTLKEIKYDLDMHIFCAPYSPGLFHCYDEMDKTLSELLQPVLPRSETAHQPFWALHRR